MKKRICANCKYFRDGNWCSKFESDNFRYADEIESFVSEDDTCNEFTQINEKCPVNILYFNSFMKKRADRRRDDRK